ncbi:MAG TPA: thiamine phosphate synthase [Gammaproteobacteria bacterium]|nr:thiamine phosphate synthase [Gammaproteobacteria bacterium]
MRGLYVVTDASITDPELLYRQVDEAVAGGSRLVQFRHKTIDSGLYLALADAVLEACRRNFTPCLINDQVSIAKVLAADGAHLGQGDGSLLDARQSLGPHAVLGRTCHGSQEFMEQAVADGASYCAFGRLFDSDTKPQASGLSLHQLKDLVSQCAIPTVAIGGITLDNGRQILDTGVAMLAVSGAVFRAKEIGEAARRLSELF